MAINRLESRRVTAADARGDTVAAWRAAAILAAVAGWSLLAWWQTQADRLAAQRYYDERARASELRDTLDTMHAVLRRLDQRTP